MATQEQAEAAVSRILVALNACESLGLDFQAIVDWRHAVIAEGRQITEEDMRQLATTLVAEQNTVAL